MAAARLVSVNVGLPRDITWRGKTVHTGIWKSPVPGRLIVRKPMLHSLAAEISPRQVWWLFGARKREDHAFAEESRNLVKALPNGKSFIAYSRPGPRDRPGVDFDASGRLTIEVLEKLGVPRDADFYPCGPAAFLRDLSDGLKAWGVLDHRVHTENFGPGKSITPGVVDPSHAARTRQRGLRVRALECRWCATASRCPGTQSFPAFLNWRKPVMCRCVGRAERGSATSAKAA